MAVRIIKLFQDDRKYYTVVFFVLLLIAASALITPVIFESIEKNWKDILKSEISDAEQKTRLAFRKQEDDLLTGLVKLKSELRNELAPGANYGSLIELLNSIDYEKFSVEVYAPNGRLIGWNKNSPVRQELPFPLKASIGESYFTNTGLMTWLSVLDTVNFDAEHFYIMFYLPFQKHYRIKNNYYQEVNFEKNLSRLLATDVSVNYFSHQPETRDGRYHTFDLLNSNGSRTAKVTILKPLLDSSINSIRETSSLIQSLLLITAYLFLMIALRGEYKEINSRIIRFFILALYLTGFRILLYFLNIPSVLFNGTIDDPSYFASAFAWGMVKSPVEFFVTNIFLLLIAISFFVNIRESARWNRLKSYWYYVIIVPVSFLFLMTARGMSAAVRSIIFDSSIRYFKSPEILSGLPEEVMILNLLLLGMVVVIILISFLVMLLSLRRSDLVRYYWISFTVFQVSGFLFVIWQKQPLITPVMQFVFITLIFITVWYVLRKRESVFNFIYIALAASVISISLLNYFNQHLERESLKTTAIELNRPDENLLNFLIRETLGSAAADNYTKEAITGRESNFTALAFALWTKSPLQEESLNSSLALLDRNKKYLGGFSIGVNNETDPAKYFEHYSGVEIQVAEIEKDEYRKVFKGIIPVKVGERIYGYLIASVELDLRNPAGTDYPEFLVSKKNFFNSVIDASQIKIFEIIDSELTYVFGDIYPSRDQIKPVINADYGTANESWQTMEMNNERYISYALKNIVGGKTKITVVLYREKQITWNLFNFFKIFISHVIYILIFFVIIFIINIRKFRYTFRMQLLTAFLLISIIPVIILAAFIRQTVNERSSTAITTELNERLEYIENHVRSQMIKHKDRDYNDAFENAAIELGISFNVYDNTYQTFSSKKQYYASGLFTSRLNPVAYYKLNYLSFREFLTEQEVENFTYSAFFKKLDIGGKRFILSVNDAFNKVKLSFTPADADILLFGVYSFAVIIIIIINTILANKISAPIRQLIRATGSVAQGDLSVQLVNKEKGELRDLIDGFNLMTSELRKNEAELAQLERETAWKEMAKQVAHEIKNPLTPMKLAVQQMIISFKENKNFSSIFTRVSETLLNQIENLNQIASEFSRFARMPHFNLEKVNISEVLKDTVNLFVDEKITIETEIEKEDALVEADISQFRRLIINMIRNSIQADADKITVSLKKCTDGYELYLKDNGKGIPPALQEKIFDPDFTTKEKGMGLGLKLAKRFVEGIKGEILLESSSGNGTVFRIFIPEIK